MTWPNRLIVSGEYIAGSSAERARPSPCSPLIEAYADGDAGSEHVNSEHFKKAMKEQGRYAATRPKVISYEIPQDGWSELGEIEMPEDNRA